VVSLNPSGGSGSSQVFTAVVRDPNGGQTLSWVQMLISATGSAANACYLHYQQSTNTFWLFDDQATGGAGLWGGVDSVQNSQCVLRRTGSTATASGTDLTVKFDVTFKSAFAGSKQIWLLGVDATGNSTGWVPVGNWTAP
jgi:hypothetical protein